MPFRPIVHDAPAVTIRVRFVLVLAAALAVGPTAAAKSIPISIGDTVDVTGTKITCFAVKSDGKKAIACFLTTSKSLTAGTYGVGLSEVGDAVVNQVKADRSTKLLWIRTVASARSHRSRDYRATGGDIFGFTVKGGNLVCKVIDITSGNPKHQGRKVACWRSTETTPFPNTYGVAVSSKFAASFRYDAKGNPGPNAFARFQP